MSTDIATINHSGTAVGMVGGFGVEGFEGLGQSDIILPRWSLIQPTSKKTQDDSKVGQFMRNIDGQFAPALTGVLLQVHQSRLLWSGDLQDKRPECFSRDGTTGSKYGNCAACQFNVQHNPALREQLDKGLTPKICSYGYTYLLIDDLEVESMALLGAMGTSVRPAKVLNTQFIQRKRPIYSAVVKIESERQVNERGKFYVLKPSVVRWLDLNGEEAARYRDRYLELQGAVLRDIDEDEEPGAPGASAPATPAAPAAEEARF